MRTLVLLRGLPGCGKSRFVAENGLQPYTLSSDNFRLLYGSITKTPEGKDTISGAHDKYVWKMLFDVLEKRMEEGLFTVIDATNIKRKDINKYRNLAATYRYRIYCVDFSEVLIEVCKRNNENREEYKYVPEAAIERMALQLAAPENKLPSDIKVIKPYDFDLFTFFHHVDFSKYKNVHIIGDVHGCADPIKAYLNEIHDNDFYIFCGDYVDRGIQNAETLKFLMPLAKRNNFLFLEGNHEAHLSRWAHNLDVHSKEFRNETAPELEAAGITKKEVREFCRKLGQCAYFRYNKNFFLVTHGGIPCLPNVFTPTKALIHGYGSYNDVEIEDDAFCTNHSLYPNYYSIHGHRNPHGNPIRVNDKCFNLEGAVEFGGELRVVKLHGDEILTYEIENKTFKAFDYGKIDKPLPTTVEGVVEALRSTSLVKEKQFGHISSFNFTRAAFTKGMWSNVTMKARGLFINTKTNEIAARSYDKFFNAEQEPNSIEFLRENLVYPVTAYIKENGYLGIVGYDSETDDFLFCSKSTPNSEHAQWLKEIFYEKIGDKTERFKNYLKANHMSAVFEVTDPINDPHIIDYADRNICLLDIIKNEMTFHKVPYEVLQTLGHEYGFCVKEKAYTLNNWDEFFKWYNEVITEGYKYNEMNIEGFVLEDANGYMFKVKGYYYNFWKHMRTVANAVINSGHYSYTNSLSLEGQKFYHWLLHRPPFAEGTTINTIRKAYFEET